MADQLSNRARLARERAGFRTEKDAAQRIGCSRTLVISWENGSAKSIGGKYLIRAAKAYQVRPEWLSMQSQDDGYPWHGIDATLPEPVSDPATAHSYRVSQIDAEAGMGGGLANHDYPDVIKEVDFDPTYIRALLGFVPKPGRLKLVTGRGDSMTPTINPGDVVIVDTGCEAFDGDGIYLIDTGNGAQIKRLQALGDGVHVISANKEYKDFPAPPHMRVGGRVYLRNRLDRMA